MSRVTCLTCAAIGYPGAAGRRAAFVGAVFCAVFAGRRRHRPGMAMTMVRGSRRGSAQCGVERRGSQAGGSYGAVVLSRATRSALGADHRGHRRTAPGLPPGDLPRACGPCRPAVGQWRSPAVRVVRLVVACCVRGVVLGLVEFLRSYGVWVAAVWTRVTSGKPPKAPTVLKSDRRARGR